MVHKVSRRMKCLQSSVEKLLAMAEKQQQMLEKQQQMLEELTSRCDRDSPNMTSRSTDSSTTAPFDVCRIHSVTMFPQCYIYTLSNI